jgi:hydrogenase nickel incorporation protein HypA/HybF
MHEASLAGGILQLVEDAARREGFRRVTRLRLEAGQLAGVEPRALRFAIEALAPGTCLAGAELLIDEPPGQAWCLRCGGTVRIAQRGDACPDCGGYQLQPVGGTELRVVDLLVDDEGPVVAPAPMNQEKL